MKELSIENLLPALMFQSLIVGETTSTGVGECVSSATAALMSLVPPPHFCSTVVRLIALQILAIGVSKIPFNFPLFPFVTCRGDEKCMQNLD
jgi:hypothetical protein